MSSKTNKTAYYLIRENTVGKREKDDENLHDYLFIDGKWVRDTETIIADRLIGYDSFEPVDSPYSCGNTDVLNEIEEISEEKAFDIMAVQIKAFLSEKWKKDFAEEKRAWDEAPRWLAKSVDTQYMLYGKKFSIAPTDIGLTYDGWDQGFMETVQGRIESDLADYGATDIRSFGFID